MVIKKNAAQGVYGEIAKPVRGRDIATLIAKNSAIGKN
jgi:hypothetical protein